MGSVARVAVPVLLIAGAAAATYFSAGAAVPAVAGAAGSGAAAGTAAGAGVAAPALLGGTGAFVNAAGVTVGAPAGASAGAGLLTAGNAGLGMSALSGLTSSFAAYRGAQAQKTSAKYEADAARRNAGLADLEAADALQRGADAEARHRLQVAQLMGRQRNAFAANGVALDSESALDVFGDTAALGELDAMTIRLNAEREACSARAGAAGMRGQAGLTSAEASGITPWIPGTSTLLSSASTFASQWYRNSHR